MRVWYDPSARDSLQATRQTDGGVSCYEPYHFKPRRRVNLQVGGTGHAGLSIYPVLRCSAATTRAMASTLSAVRWQWAVVPAEPPGWPQVPYGVVLPHHLVGLHSRERAWKVIRTALNMVGMPPCQPAQTVWVGSTARAACVANSPWGLNPAARRYRSLPFHRRVVPLFSTHTRWALPGDFPPTSDRARRHAGPGGVRLTSRERCTSCHTSGAPSRYTPTARHRHQPVKGASTANNVPPRGTSPRADRCDQVAPVWYRPRDFRARDAFRRPGRLTAGFSGRSCGRR